VPIVSRIVSIVLPCLNEAEALADCIADVRRGVEALGPGFEAEILVVDNGSTDGSGEIAKQAGAKVISERRLGYGSALGRGIKEAAGEIVITGDADGSYRFDRLALFVEPILAGADLVVGSRLRGRIEPGAMPWLHRRLGTPVLTFLVNRFFGTRISDVNCGQRALRRATAQALDLRAAGMEFASEMVVKAALAGYRIEEVPVDFQPDRRSHPPHLRTWRDGWRHLRFLLLLAPNIVLVGPGFSLLAVGAVLGGPAWLGHPAFGGAAAFGGAVLVLIGAQMVQVGILVKTWYHVEGFYRRPYLERLFRYVGFEVGLLAGIGLLVIGGIAGVPLLVAWHEELPVSSGRVAASLTFLVAGIQVIGTSVLMSVLGIRRRRG